MSLYNALFGTNEAADVVLASIGLTRSDVGRFRDAGVADGEIYVYTRNGGGNREEYWHVFDSLRLHPLYLRDADDDFDPTYATIYFKLPDEFADDLRKLDEPSFIPSERWTKMLATIGDIR